jgi:hypothetical protein
LGGLYLNLVATWQSSGYSSISCGNSSYSALKTLRRLLIAGFENAHRDNAVQQFWSILQTHQQSFWDASSANIHAEQQLLLMKHSLQLSKLFLDMARNHPASFVLLGCSDILTRSWTIISHNDARQSMTGKNFDWQVYRDGDDTEGDPVEKLCLKALLLFRASLKMVFNPVQTFRYVTPADKEDRKNAVDYIKASILSEQFVIRLMEILVTQYFVLRPSDLRDWEQEPDEWERREEEIADAWEFSIRSCSEKLFLDLIINFKELLVPRLLQVFSQYASTSNGDVLLKDSLYSAVGIAAACIEDVLDFNAFLRNTLVPEVQMNQPSYNLLRRRTAILLGQWVPIKPVLINRVAVYQIFAHLLSTREALNDHVVSFGSGALLEAILTKLHIRSVSLLVANSDLF